MTISGVGLFPASLGAAFFGALAGGGEHGFELIEFIGGESI
jgi:hypothetical protein